MGKTFARADSSTAPRCAHGRRGSRARGAGRSACLGVLALIAPACGRPPETVSLVIRNVTVIDPASRQVLGDRSVFVAEDRIRAVGPAGEHSGLAATDTIDGTGRFLVPGFIDSHVHLGRSVDAVELDFALMVANGVTGIRVFGADCWVPAEGEVCLEGFRTLAGEIGSGRRTGPRLLSLTSEQINGPRQRAGMPDGALPIFGPGTEEEGRALARYLKERGVDVIKVYSWIPRAAYFGILDEADSLGIEVSGHLPAAVTLVEASDGGQRTVEHARDLPVACSTYGPEYHARMNDAIEGVEGARGVPWERIRDILDGFDAEICDGVLRALVSNGTYLVPTLGTREFDARADEEAYLDDARLKYVSAGERGWWNESANRVVALGPEIGALFDEQYPFATRLIARAHGAGVKILVGTDTGSPMIFPGFGVHDEMGRLAAAGLAPMAVLRAATTLPAEYLGRTDDLGGISAGRLADLVLLDADPLADVRNVTAINTVMMAGRVYDRTALDALLRGVEARVAESGGAGG